MYKNTYIFEIYKQKFVLILKSEGEDTRCK